LTALPLKRTIAKESPINNKPQSYVLNKFKTHDIVFLGTRHKQPPILSYISNLIKALHNSGVTHIGLEIESDQQEKIDRFIKTGAGLNDIRIHPQIDCPEYMNLFNVIRDLEPDKRPTPVALDLPKSKYKGKISRDEWMAESISNFFKSNTNAKILVVLGNLHIFKKLELQDKVINKHRSIREYLSEKRSNPRFFSIGQVIGESIYEDDFAERFGPMKGYPVFIAQHGTSTCCRRCISKWHGIEKGRALSEVEVEFIVAAKMGWIKS
jgi:hypothetical protein